MSLDAIRNISKAFNGFEGFAALAFFASLPLLPPCLDCLYGMLAQARTGPAFLLETPGAMLWTLPIAAMFTALTILFVCLLKTSYLHIGRSIMIAGGIAYIIGYFSLALAVWIPALPGAILAGSGILLGFGLAILSIAWIVRMRFGDFRTSFVALAIALFIAAVACVAVQMIPPTAGMCILCLLALVGTVGGFRAYRRDESHRIFLGDPGSNWWDVFGRIDITLVEGTEDFKALASRIVFFIATPLVILLLFTLNRETPTVLLDPHSPVTLACILMVPCALPLLFIKSEQALINVSFRLYLPLIAFGVFAADSVIADNLATVVMNVGINVFCILYALMLAAMVVAVAGRMRSLALPACGILLIGLSLVSILSYTEADAGSLIAFQHYALVFLLVLAVAMLLASPGSQMWRMMADGVSSSAASAQEKRIYRARCDSLAQIHRLTAREAEILIYLGHGYSAAYIATLLSVAESTVRSHRKSIYHKLNVNSREELLDLFHIRNDVSNP